MTAATLTLSQVEQTAVLRHLVIQHDRLPPSAEDRLVLAVIIGHVSTERTFSLAPIEAVVMLRYIRKQVTALNRDLMALEERRIRGGVDGTLDAAYHALDADMAVLQDVVKRLWQIVL